MRVPDTIIKEALERALFLARKVRVESKLHAATADSVARQIERILAIEKER